jgi:Tfp pilus assembly PilM family ATPase
MKARAQTLPLGVDIGRKRVRVALSARMEGAAPTLIAVASRDHTGDPITALRDACTELHTAERRCVLALGAPDALLRTVDFPPMSRWERARAARFEAARFIDYPIAEAAISLVAVPGTSRWAIGIARRSALAEALHTARGARLRALGVDDAAFALRRAHSTVAGVIDVGDEATRLTVFGHPIPFVACIPIGGEQLTDAIAQSLGIGLDAAEERKRSIGFGGAGDAQRDTLIAALSEALADARAVGYPGAGTIVLCGNGSRVPGFAIALEHAAGYPIRAAGLEPDCSTTLPSDVLRAAAADWSVAFGLSLWATVS